MNSCEQQSNAHSLLRESIAKICSHIQLLRTIHVFLSEFLIHSVPKFLIMFEIFWFSDPMPE